jgi:hypothetical protein
MKSYEKGLTGSVSSSVSWLSRTSWRPPPPALPPPCRPETAPAIRRPNEPSARTVRRHSGAGGGGARASPGGGGKRGRGEWFP